MSMIDLKNLDKLSPEQRTQFDSLLEQFPHLDSKMKTSRELNTPTKFEEEKAAFVQPTPASKVNEEIDYSTFMAPAAVGDSSNKTQLPKMKVDAANNSFSSLEATETPPPPPNSKEALEAEAKRKEYLEKQKIKAGLEAGQPLEVASFSPEGKTHPILQKLRATLGMRAIQPPVVHNIGGCDYAIKALDRSSLANATYLAANTTSNPALYESNLETAIIAFAVVEIDGVALADVFSIPEDAGDGREQKASEAFYFELMNNPNELTDLLGVYYQQDFPRLNLLGEGKVKFYCPVADCLQSRIEDYNAVCFCPIHGEKMAQETRLPNPS